MNAKFNVGGYEIEINTSGHLCSPDGLSGASVNGAGVGLQLIHHPITIDGRERPVSLMQAFLKPSEARAVASALLSAATDAKGF